MQERGAPMWYRTRADIAFCKLTSKEGHRGCGGAMGLGLDCPKVLTK